MRIRLAAAVLSGAVSALAVGIVSASPPASSGGYWLTVDIVGEEPGRSDAITSMQPEPDVVSPKDEVAGEPVGRVESVQEAIDWVAIDAFDGAPLGVPEDVLALREAHAPLPGGRLMKTHGALLLGVSVLGATKAGGLRIVNWPRDPLEVVPEHLPWTRADLLSTRAPVFAAPSPALPPMRERYAVARRNGAVYRLGMLDRCRERDGVRECLRWAQVVARTGNRFVAGYIPAFQVAEHADWVHGVQAHPAAQLIYSGVRGDVAQILLITRAPDGTFHRKTIEAPMVGERFPKATVSLAGATVTIDIEGAGRQRHRVDTALDRYPRKAAGSKRSDQVERDE
jgi:hypothetical protein